MFLFVLFGLLRLLWLVVRLLLQIVLLPFRVIAVGLALQIAILLAFVAVLGVLAYMVYQWIM